MPNIVTSAIAAGMDRVALLGSDMPPEPEGVGGLFEPDGEHFTGSAPTGYGDLMLARRAHNIVNSELTGVITHSRDESSIAESLDGNGQSVLPPPALEMVSVYVSNKISTNGGVRTNVLKIFAVDWSKLLIGIRHNIRIEVLKERYASENQYAFVAVLRADVAAEHEAAFAVMEGITP